MLPTLVGLSLLVMAGPMLLRLRPAPSAGDGRAGVLAAGLPGPAATGPPPSPDASAGTPVMATVRGLAVHLPSAAVVAVGYHEASLPEALELHPVGRCARDFNRTKFTCPPPTAGPRYLIMSSRGRPHPATSGVDVAMAPGQRVLAPVTGRVVGVRRYFLYGRYVDERIAINPAGSPDLQVVVIHVDHVAVHKGSWLRQGETAIGTVRAFPFASQVNDYVGPGIPHVHVEVKERGT